MIEKHPTNVIAAFEMLLEEIEAEIDFVNRVGSRAFEGRDYDKAKEALESSARVTGFRDNADNLRRDWENLFAREEDEEGSEAHAERRNLGRLRRGLRTREEVYTRPILNALKSMGGSGQMSKILDKVQRNMKKILKAVDYEPLASDPEMPRWKNAAQWARNTMVKDGLLRNDSPRGIWQITDAGKRLLND